MTVVVMNMIAKIKLVPGGFEYSFQIRNGLLYSNASFVFFCPF